MNHPKPDDLLAYLYDEADDHTREAVDERLRTCDQTRLQLENWRATMSLLDQWEVQAGLPPRRTLWPRIAPVLQAAAAIALLLGFGALIGRQWTPPDTSRDISAAAVEARVQERLSEERAKWAAIQEEIEKNLILASGGMTHRHVQDYLGRALKHLQTHAVRNETLAMFLPPEERQAYEEERTALTSVAAGIARENQRRELFTKQIIDRARARALRAH